jgi:hypothetical protein
MTRGLLAGVLSPLLLARVLATLAAQAAVHGDGDAEIG